MPPPEAFAAFAAASLALLVIPGPSVLYIVTRSIQQGRAAGVVSVLGVHTGSIVHVAAAAFGLSAILASSAVSFGVVKYAGAAYLIWLGVQAIRRADGGRRHVARRSDPLRRIYAQGVVVNVLNPKTALFFLAFLPQFVDPSRGSTTVQIVVLGLTFILLGFVSDGGYALLSARVSRALLAGRRAGAVRRWVPGLTLVGLGIVAAFTDHRRTASAWHVGAGG